MHFEVCKLTCKIKLINVMVFLHTNEWENVFTIVNID